MSDSSVLCKTCIDSGVTDFDVIVLKLYEQEITVNGHKGIRASCVPGRMRALVKCSNGHVYDVYPTDLTGNADHS